MVGQASVARAETTSAEPGGRIGNIVLWVVQVVLALVFAGSGISKLAGDGSMVDMFADIGIGQWFRYLTGAIEIVLAGAILVPRACGLAAAGMAAVMVGAIIATLARLDDPIWVPLILLIVAAGVAFARWPRTRRLLDRSTR
ncbi:MAG TPA: DoxX family protein [Thermomicrobiales bacterium]|jgi:uncharacterized membrane protein YphA (DoxX/SURF4 family)|nr:DoxX family protein [Thermomicrobiales bacterium]